MMEKRMEQKNKASGKFLGYMLVFATVTAVAVWIILAAAVTFVFGRWAAGVIGIL